MSELRGLSYDEQVQALSPTAQTNGSTAAGEVTPGEVPGTLYSNTSKSNLNKTSDWPARIGVALGREYEAQVSFTDLVRAGHRVKAPSATDIGNVQAPRNAVEKNPLEYDFVETPTGRVSEKGTARFSLRGGAGAGEHVTLRFANNGGLNLARMARAAYELAVDKGVTFQGQKIDWKGQTFDLNCVVQMGNELDAKDARAYGYVGLFDLAWIHEKVNKTVEIVAMTTALAIKKGMTDRRSAPGDWVHPNHENTGALQTPHHSVNEEGIREKTGEPIYDKTFDRTRRSGGWAGQPEMEGRTGGPGRQAWVTDPNELAQRAQVTLKSSWAPGGDWKGHPTFITECPDFTATLLACFKAAGGTYGSNQKEIEKHIMEAVKAIGVQVQGAPMNYELLDDPEQQAKLEAANKAIIANAFQTVNTGKIKGEIESFQHPRNPPHTKPSEKPVAGKEQNTEGMVVLRNWDSRDGR